MLIRLVPFFFWVLLLATPSSGLPEAYSQNQSSLVYPGPDGRLIYQGYANEGQTNADNIMIDFSRAGYGGGGVAYRYHFNGALRNVGIERMRLESALASDTDEDHGWSAVKFRRVENGWARQVTASTCKTTAPAATLSAAPGRTPI